MVTFVFSSDGRRGRDSDGSPFESFPTDTRPSANDATAFGLRARRASLLSRPGGERSWP